MSNDASTASQSQYLRIFREGLRLLQNPKRLRCGLWRVVNEDDAQAVFFHSDDVEELGQAATTMNPGVERDATISSLIQDVSERRSVPLRSALNLDLLADALPTLHRLRVSSVEAWPDEKGRNHVSVLGAITVLPTFGGAPPEDGVWRSPESGRELYVLSWDKHRLLVGNDWSDVQIVLRKTPMQMVLERCYEIETATVFTESWERLADGLKPTKVSGEAAKTARELCNTREETLYLLDSDGGWRVQFRDWATGSGDRVTFDLIRDTDHWIYEGFLTEEEKSL